MALKSENPVDNRDGQEGIFRLKVTKTARIASLGPESGELKMLVIALHGYGQLANFFIRKFGILADGETRIVAPEGLSRFYVDGVYGRVGASWMTKEDRLDEIADQLEYLEGVLEHLAERHSWERLVLLGFSQGVATAWRWLRSGSVKPNRLIIWSGAIPEPDDRKVAEKLSRTEMDLVYSLNDPWIKAADAAAKAADFQSIYPQTRVHTYPDGHKIDPELLGSLFKSFPD